MKNRPSADFYAVLIAQISVISTIFLLKSDDDKKKWKKNIISLEKSRLTTDYKTLRRYNPR